MLKKSITYTDYEGVERTEDFFFNLTPAEITKMELGTTGGLGKMIEQILAAKEIPSIIKLFEDLVYKAYGEKSPDGKYFLKKDAEGHDLAAKFAQTEAYSTLFMELATNADAASAFINGIMPNMDKYANANTNNPAPPAISMS